MEEYLKDFEITVTLLPEHRFGINVFRGGENMSLTMAICEFANYMDWFYDIVVKSEYDSKFGFVCECKDKCTDENKLKTYVEMFIFENRNVFDTK